MSTQAVLMATEQPLRGHQNRTQPKLK